MFVFWVFGALFTIAAVIVVIMSQTRYRNSREKLQEALRTVHKERAELEYMNRELRQEEYLLQTRYAMISAVERIIRSINREANMETLLSSVLESLMTLIPAAQKSSMYVFDAERNLFRFRAVIGYDLEMLVPITLTRPEAEHRWTGTDWKVADGVYLVKEFPATNEGSKFGDVSPPACALSMTIVNNNLLMGVVFLDNFDSTQAFTMEDVDKLIALREHISAAFEKVHTIDQLERQSEELRKANALKTEFLGIAAHDLKNPLFNIKMLADMLQQDFQQASPEEMETSLEMIGTLSDKMLDLIKNLLDVNALEQGKMNILVEAVDIVPEICRSIDTYTTPAFAKRITLHAEMPEEVRVLADETALMQTIDNLISNAVKYSPQGKNIVIRVVKNEESQTVRFEVQDEGPGLSDEDKTKLFGKFARLSAQPTGGEHSTGLGLSIVKRMVEAMHGRVWCESVLGQGATFIVELPLAS